VKNNSRSDVFRSVHNVKAGRAGSTCGKLNLREMAGGVFLGFGKMKRMRHDSNAPGRRLGACVCLVALMLLWAPAWASALQAAGIGCCDGAMCPLHGHAPKKSSSDAGAAKDAQPPVCEHHGKAAMDCTMGVLPSHGSGCDRCDYFVLPSPVAILRRFSLVLRHPPCHLRRVLLFLIRFFSSANTSPESVETPLHPLLSL